jgi:hypothetical protein
MPKNGTMLYPKALLRFPVHLSRKKPSGETFPGGLMGVNR